MKFCPNCGSILEGKLKCNCGYDTLTGEVDEKIYKDFKNKEKSLYEQSSDNLRLMGTTNQYDMITGAKMMGINPNLSKEETVHRLTKSELEKIQEEALLWITNPGRMGDEDGITFIIKESNALIIYRVDGLLYSKENGDIFLNDIEIQFPKWFETWKHQKERDYHGKYQYLYMGFGNGLSIDNSIYKEYKPFLDDLVEDYLKDKGEEEKKSLQYAAIYQVWKKAVLKMAREKGYIIK